MEKIKIIEVIADAGLGGGPKHVLGILSHIDMEKFEPFLICPKGSFAKEADKIDGLKVFEVEMKSKFDIVAMFQIKQIVQKIRAYRDPFGPLVVHTHGARAGFLTRIFLPSSVTSVYTEHSYVDNFHLRNPLNEYFQKTVSARLNSKTDKIIAVSTSVKDFLVQTKLASQEQVVVIPNGIDLAQIQKDKQIKKTRADKTNPIIGTIGNLNIQKGHSYLVDAMKTVLQKYPQATLEIVGEGDGRIMLEEQTKASNLEHHITLLGQKKDIEKYLKRWDVFVLPSIAETFGIVVLEAMAAGLPVVASRTGGITDIIDNKSNGLLVEPRNPAKLAEAILQMIDHPAQAAKFKRAGLETVKEFDWSKVIKKIEKVYVDAVRSSAS